MAPEAPPILPIAAELLAEIMAVEQNADGRLISIWLDADGTHLTELTWLPGQRLSARHTTLSEPIGAFPQATSVAGNLLLVARQAELKAIERTTGAVTLLAASDDPAVFSPNGRVVIAATEHGLVDFNLIHFEGSPPKLQGARPLAMGSIDSPCSLAAVPTGNPEEFYIVAGGYGCLVQIEISWRMPYLPAAKVYAASTGKLPYDPLYIARPAPLSKTAGSRLYVTDQGRAGLLSLDLFTAGEEDCPLDDRNYGAVRQVVPCLDGHACLVLARDDRFWRWEPGWSFEIAELPGFPLLWHEQRALVFSDGEVREIALP